MKTKKILALIMAIMMCLTLIPSYALADDTVTFTAIDGKTGNGGENYTNLFDGKKTNGNSTKYCVGMGNVYVVIKASESVLVTGYTFTTGNDNQTYPNRNPKSWVLYGCDDYDEVAKTGSWEMLHSVTNDNTMEDRNFTPFGFTFDNTKDFMYYKFEFTENRGDGEMQLCEIEFDYRIPGKTSFRAIDGKKPNNSAEDYSNLFDGKKTNGNSTKYCVSMGNVYVVIKASESALVTGYTFTTGNDNQSYPNRNPKSWVLYGCDDYDEAAKTGSWEMLHSVTNDNTMEDRNFTPFGFTFDNTKDFMYYKFEFTENRGSDVIQLCEIEFEYTVVTHEWEVADDKKDPGCTEDGYIKRICKACNKAQTEKIPPLGHDWKEERKEASTCTEVGHSYQKCSRCNAEQTVDIPIIDHNWETLSRTEATCFDDGKLTERCTACGNERESVIPPIGHEAGADNKCKNCNKEIIQVGNDSSYTYYFDLQTAVNNASSTQTVTLLQNIAISDTLSIGNTTTIDLNGFTLKQVSDKRVIKISGKLTLKDSSAEHTGTIIGGLASGIGYDAAGGGVYIDDFGEFEMEAGTISNCSTSGDGGGVYICGNGKMYMGENAVISKCTAGNDGGGVYISNTGTMYMGKNTVITECAADSDGGGIMVNYGGTLTVEGGEITHCTAGNYGGGIRADGRNVTGTVNLTSAKINYCEAKVSGGGICTWVTPITLTNSKLENNTANYGGGISAILGSTVTFVGGKVDSNTAKEHGGGIHTESDASLSLNSTIISSNRADVLAAGIYAGGKSITVRGAANVSRNIIVHENETGEDEIESNIYLPKGKTITIADDGLSEICTDETGYINPAINVTTASLPQNITGPCSEENSKYFRSDIGEYIVHENGTIKLLKGDLTVEFDYGHNEIRAVKVSKGYKVREPDGNPWKDGYAFVGWQKDGIDYDLSAPVTENITLTPKWEKLGDKPLIGLSLNKAYVYGLYGKKPNLYLAAYNKYGVLTDLYCTRVEEDSSISFADAKLNVDGAYKIAAFLWDENMSPLCEKTVRALQ